MDAKLEPGMSVQTMIDTWLASDDPQLVLSTEWQASLDNNQHLAMATTLARLARDEGLVHTFDPVKGAMLINRIVQLPMPPAPEPALKPRVLLASELILRLRVAIDNYGDLPVIGGYLTDTSPPWTVTALDADDVSTMHGGGAPVAFFLESTVS